MQKFIKITALLLCLSIFAAFTACKSEPTEKSNEKLSVVCTLFPQYDFVRALVGDNVEVTLLLTPGTDSHSYDPSPVDMVKINECDLFIYTGELMESWAVGVISGLDEAVTVLDVSQGIELSAVENSHGHSHEEHSHSADPHVWTSLENAQAIVEKISETLAQLDPQNSSLYNQNKQNYIQQLRALDDEIRESVESAENKFIVMCDRFAMHYFCKSYGLEYIAAFDSCTANTEPSPSVIVDITKAVEEKEIKAVFAAELSNRKVADAVAKQTGAQVLELHSCHNLSSDDFNAGETYLSLMQRNAANLKIALGVN